jgi:bacillithiol biosynthesis deacetylase BshB1
MKLDVLAIGAHPDDVELSCGGTVIKLVRQGRSVGVLDLTEGELGTRGTREIRAAEAAAAAEVMGVAVRLNAGFPDGNIENTFDARKKLIEIFRAYRPDVLLFPYPVDRHPDHEHAHILCREAWFYGGLEKIPTTWEGAPQEPFRPRSYYHFMQWFEFQPTFIVDVTAEFDTRMEAMRAYKSQFYDPQSSERSTILSTPEFIEMIKTRLRAYGNKIGRTYGEPFFSPHPMAVSDVWALHS